MSQTSRFAWEDSDIVVIAEKDAVTDEAGAFGSDLDTLVHRAYRSRVSLATFVAEMNELLSAYIRSSYLAGLAEGGVDEDEVDAADERVIRQMVEAQRGYVDGFAEAVMAAKSEDELREAIDRRVVYWSRSIVGAGQAGLASSKSKEIMEWQLGATDIHCTGANSCTWLNGQRHTRQWFVKRGFYPGVPGSSTKCKGFNCGCELVPYAGLRSSMISHGMGNQ